MQNNRFLPTTKEEIEKRKWDVLDIIIVSGDAYVDHPSFGTAIIGRVLEHAGFKVGIISQPDWRSIDDFTRLGEPRLCFMVTAGNIDSMVNHYTARKKRRRQDAYSPGGKSGLRPDRATIVYSNRLREAFGKKPIVLGGIEASLRRFAHYDYWDDKVRRSVLFDTRADLLVYGMGEFQSVAIAEQLNQGMSIEDIRKNKGLAYISNSLELESDFVLIPSFEDISEDKTAYARAFKLQYFEQDSINGKTVVQPHGNRFLVQNPPAPYFSTKELDQVYSLPYTRTYHPAYEQDGGVPALKEVEFSVTTHRGCFGSCSFCAITHHQGRKIQNRSPESILQETKLLTQQANYKGYIHDLGGPSANMYGIWCEKMNKLGACRDRLCLYPEPCFNLKGIHKDYLQLLQRVRGVPKVKKAFIRSGLRYDLILADKKSNFLHDLCRYHVSGQLKIAPEHISKKVTDLMHKPAGDKYEQFIERFKQTNQKLKKKQYLIPYFISGHPGCGLNEMAELAKHLKKQGFVPDQVQDFTPTPGTLATCIYYTGINPFTEEKVYVPKDEDERDMQRALLQYNKPANYQLVKSALEKINREDLLSDLFSSSRNNGKQKKVKTRARGNVKGRKKKWGK